MFLLISPLSLLLGNDSLAAGADALSSAVLSLSMLLGNGAVLGNVSEAAGAADFCWSASREIDGIPACSDLAESFAVGNPSPSIVTTALEACLPFGLSDFAASWAELPVALAEARAAFAVHGASGKGGRAAEVGRTESRGASFPPCASSCGGGAADGEFP